MTRPDVTTGHDRSARTTRPVCAAALRAGLLASSALIVAALPASAQDATWLATPGSGNFNTATNWSPATVPTSTANFSTSNTTSLSFSASTTIGGWTFNAGASNYTFTNGQSLTFNGAGIVINGGSATIINNSFGSLAFINNSTAGSAVITNNNGLQFNDTGTAGSAVITNTGTVAFALSSTAGSATITNNNNLIFNDATTAGGATVTNNNLAEFNFTSTAGSATIINNSFGTLNFSGTSTAGTATITNNSFGTLNFSGNSTAGSATITNNNGGTLNFLGTSTAGSATITNNSLLEFFGNSTAGSATITNNVQLQFNDASTAGSATITNSAGAAVFLDTSTAGSATITNNAALVFFNISTGGSARLINGAGGSIDLSSLTSAGMTAGSIEGAGTVDLGSKNLAVGGNNLSTMFSGILQDGGVGGGSGASLTKTGTGALTLAGTNTYTGTTTVNAGTLLVNGSIVSSSGVTANAGGTLGGTGIVSATTINNGGTLAPGASIGTLTVQGNLVMTAAAVYLVEVSASAADRTNVTGTATLGGAVQVLAGSGGFAQRYTILHADGGLGGTTFAGGATTNMSANVNASLSYSATDVFLNLTAALGAGTSLNQNQQNVADAINTFFNNGGSLPPNFANLFGLSGGNLAAALSLASGEAATGARQGAFQLGSQFLGLMLDPFVNGRGGIVGTGGPALGFAPEREALPEDIALAYATITKASAQKAPPMPSFEQRWSVWGSGYGGYNKTTGDAVVIGSHDLTARTAGVATGLDYRLAPGAVAGFALAGGGARWDLAQGLGGGRSDAFQAGIYAATRSGPWYLTAALAFAEHWMLTDRSAPFGNRLTADFDAQSLGGRLEGGYRFGTPATGITPYGALQAQSLHTPSYSETDVTGGGFGLTYSARTATNTRSELGARFDHVALVDSTAVLTLRGRVAWAHDWVSDPTLAAAFQTLSGASFIVNGAVPAKDSALVSAGAELRLAGGVTFLGKFDGEFAGGSNTYAGTGGIRVNW